MKDKIPGRILKNQHRDKGCSCWCTLFRLQLAPEHLKPDLVLPDLQSLRLQFVVELSQLLIQAVLVCLEEADLLAVYLVSLSLLLDLLGAPLELLLLDSKFVSLLLEGVSLGLDLAMVLPVFCLLLVELLLRLHPIKQFWHLPS